MSETAGAVSAPILVERDGAVARVVLNRPDRLNSFNVDMHRALRAAMEAIAADDSVRAVLLTGAGRGFCAGQALAEARLVTLPEPPTMRPEELAGRLRDLTARLAS